MHKKNVIAIVLTAVIFIAAAVLGISTVYRVNSVTLDASVVSEAAEAEANELRARLLKRYENESIFFAKKEEAEEDFSAFPYFRMTSFEKVYPNRLVISAAEDAEVFALKSGDEYLILSGNGTVLGNRDTPVNRSDGADNILVEGLKASGGKGEIIAGDELIPPFLSFCVTASPLLDGLRSNVVSLEAVKPTSSLKDAYFLLTMREGVKAYIRNPLALAGKKAEALVSFYLSLEAAERLGGRIEVTDDALNPGNILLSYSKNV